MTVPDQQTRIQDGAITHLVNNQCLPLDLTQVLRISQREFVGGQQDIHLQFLVRRAKFVAADNLAGGSGANVGDNVEIRGPQSKLRLPSSDGR